MDPIFAPIIIGIVIALVPSVILAVMKRKWSRTDNDSADDKKQTYLIEQMQKSVWRLNKTVLIMAKIIDDQTARNHPELANSLEDIATELLRESE